MKKDLDFIDNLLTDTDETPEKAEGATISENISEATENDWIDFWLPELSDDLLDD